MEIDPVAIGERVKKARLTAGFRSQQALAEKIGVARETINRIEQGRQQPDTPTLAAIARVCKVSESHLLGTERKGRVDDVDRLIARFRRSEDALLLSPPATDKEIEDATEELRGATWERRAPTTKTVALIILSFRSAK